MINLSFTRKQNLLNYFYSANVVFKGAQNRDVINFCVSRLLGEKCLTVEIYQN